MLSYFTTPVLIRCIARLTSAVHRSSSLSYFQSYNFVNLIKMRHLCNTGQPVIEIFALPDRNPRISIVL